MLNWNQASEQLTTTLKLNRQPVGVKFIKIMDSFTDNNYDQKSKRRFCQALMRASHGEKILLSANNLACAAAMATFGFRPLHSKLASGEAHFNTGTFGSIEAARKIMSEMPRLPLGEYQAILLSPLSTIEMEPDVVIIESQPEHLMWLALASVFQNGERLQFSTSVVQACCVDATVLPFTSTKVNATLGCTGCRVATDIEPSETLIGLPGVLIPAILNNLDILNKKVIPDNRQKGVFNHSE